ncbi:MAG: putative toxin-antitoxin system toxin component, PIN family [Gemmatimonadota bacterium]
MTVAQIVLDTNVLLAGLRSRRGASFRLLSVIGHSAKFEINLSVPLVLEYEDVAKRKSKELGLTHQDIDAILDYLCAVGNHREIFYLWRPLLTDPKDELVLELAVAGGCESIVTFNARDFGAATQFGIGVESPQSFLRRIGEVE